VFFLPTEHIDNGTVPWWDAIAYAIKRTPKGKIHIEYPGADFTFGEDRDETIDEVLSLFKGPLNQDPGRFLQSLAAACEIELPTVDKTLFMSWSNASEMIQGGMTIGSHTHTHRILAKLTPEQQSEELTVSRSLIERKLNTRVRSVAYPVGAQNCFSDATMRCSRDAGFEIGFSFYGGVNLPGKTDRFNVRRVGLSSGQSFSRFRTNMNLCAVAGRDWTF
jgi:peptidoglycan/xylan/chitin deacetylase (PgdA/CDA1 family)